MKKLTLLLGVLCCYIAHAQDVIVLRNAEEISVKVKKITSSTIEYVEWGFQDGPDREVNKSEVLFIKYQNGKKEIFSDATSGSKTKSQAVSDGQKPFIKKIKFQGYGYLGLPFSSNAVGPSFDLNLGARFYDYFYLGLELGYAPIFVKEYGYSYYSGYSYYYSYWDILHDVTIGINMKGYIPVSEKLYPYANLSLGFHYPTLFGMQLGLGVDYKRLSCGMGYELLLLGGHLGYVKFGVRF